MKFADLLNKDAKELYDLYFTLKKEYLNLRILAKTTQEIKTSSIKSCKKNIARVKTRLHQLYCCGR